MLLGIRDAFRTFGALDGTLYLLGRLLQRTFHGHCRVQKYVLMAQPVPPPSAMGSARASILEIRPVEASEAARWEWPRPREVIERRFFDGAICLGAFLKGRLVGFLWAVVGPYDEDDVRTRFVPMPAGAAAWDFDIWIAPEHRLGRAFMRLWEAMNTTLHARGVRWTMSRISAFAPESLRSHKQLQAVPVGSCTYLILGPLQISLTNHEPFVHIGFTAVQRPVIAVSVPPLRGTRARAPKQTTLPFAPDQ